MVSLSFMVVYVDHVASASADEGTDLSRKRAHEPTGLHLFHGFGHASLGRC
jgi:hypothetical protein